MTSPLVLIVVLALLMLAFTVTSARGDWLASAVWLGLALLVLDKLTGVLL